ncbi:hypothetical protein [Sediminibacterium soli]|uniref:hypothetical protein n=1 Tax=Sediminibacterium soli TaxID=2698829 RepID=UPI00137B7CD1|nr:hypothetical protein [Sediminibacterium soli]NCI47888.1 hypothetical protein [Sediminibacterium soli]
MIKYKWLLGAAIGILAGYAYYYFVGCATGTCLITSNPLSSMAYGGVLGALATGIFSKKQKRENHEQ